MPRSIVTLHRWQITLAFIAVSVSFIAGLAWVNHQQNEIRNHQRILIHQQQEIQQERLASCVRTYSGVRFALHPFFKRSKRSKMGRHDLRIFNRNIARLERGCVQQVHAKGKP